MAPREAFMVAAAASLSEMFPARKVMRGIQDLATLGDADLRRGVYQLLAEGTRNWAGFTGREAQYGELSFSVLADLRLHDESGTTLAVEQAEAKLEGELLEWLQALKPTPLDAVYPVEVTYSGGLEAPNAWIVFRMKALYV